MKQALVKFQNQNGWSDKNYQYITTIEDLEYGDLIVVEVRDTYAVGVFMEYVTEGKGTKYIISKIDTEEVEKHKNHEKQKQELLDKIDNRMREAEKMERILKLAEKDTVLKGLVDELTKLESTEGD